MKYQKINLKISRTSSNLLSRKRVFYNQSCNKTYVKLLINSGKQGIILKHGKI